MRNRRLDINFKLGLLLIIFGLTWYFWNPFKKDFDLSKVVAVTLNGEMPLSNHFSKKTILYFGYTTCPTVCPMTLGTVTNALNSYAHDDVKVVFISLSPKDSFEKTYDYGQSYHKDIYGVKIGTKNIELLTRWLNLQYSDLNGETISHSGNLYIFDDKKLSKILPFGVEADTIVKTLESIEL